MNSRVNKYSKQLIIVNAIFLSIWLIISVFLLCGLFGVLLRIKADFFSRAEWTYALNGFNTLLETGATTTIKAYVESWKRGILGEKTQYYF
ncbi:MAG: hypothetical protein CM15mP70_03510 [Pelagibacteraceae bacterium]|nr:MAG: hypothetical protein CM15mP70_03510 [Pelagibacteraceae bacterium]